MRREADKDEVRQFIRAYELKQQALKELVGVYVNKAFSPHFTLTLKSALAMLILPPLTNVYYTLRPQAVLAAVMPFAVPLLCLANYIYFINHDFKNYCFTDEPEAATVREQYDILYELSYFNRSQNDFMIKLENYRNDGRRISGEQGRLSSGEE